MLILGPSQWLGGRSSRLRPTSANRLTAVPVSRFIPGISGRGPEQRAAVEDRKYLQWRRVIRPVSHAEWQQMPSLHCPELRGTIYSDARKSEEAATQGQWEPRLHVIQATEAMAGPVQGVDDPVDCSRATPNRVDLLPAPRDKKPQGSAELGVPSWRDKTWGGARKLRAPQAAPGRGWVV